MLSHAMLGTNDLTKAAAFYDPLLAMLDAGRVMTLDRVIAWGKGAPQLAVCRPFDGAPATPGNGSMTALLAPTRDLVETMHAKALELGGTDEGAPGIRGEDQNGFYGAYFRDLDGNKLCIYRYGPA